MLNKIALPTLFGIESLTAEELIQLGYPRSAIKTSDAEVSLNLPNQDQMPQAIAKLNINLRTAERVLLELASFKAVDFDQLFDQVYVLPWHQWLDEGYFIEVIGYSRKSKLHSLPSCQSIIKKAIVKKLNSHYKYLKNIVPENKRRGSHRIQFSIINNQVRLRLDTSGEPLHKRGYRLQSNEAPIRETLAAAILMISFYQRNLANGEILYDPFCGSGTFLIEAALMATRTAPGLYRSFSGAKKKIIGKKAFQIEEKKAKQESLINKMEAPNQEQAVDGRMSRKDFLLASDPIRIFGSDFSEESLNLSKNNARRAGVLDYIHFMKKDIYDISYDQLLSYLGGDRILLVTNPPYGDRMADAKEVHRLENQVKEICFDKQGQIRKGLRLSLITPNNNLEETFANKADKRRKLYNGGIPCTLFHYFKHKYK